MFGPVMIEMRFFFMSRTVSLGTKASFSIMRSTTGWRPALMSITPSVLIFGLTKRFLRAVSDSDERTSISAIMRAVCWMRTRFSPIVSRTPANSSYSSEFSLSSAPRILSSSSLRRGVV